MRKRSLKRFSYMECDAFAEYLEKMTRQGWHFKEWHVGLVFEKGAPKDSRYDVEVFPQGSEMDKRPEPETQEYSQYCSAAGWRMIDAQKKYCIFLCEKEDAVPIVDREEKFCNVVKAERKNRYSQCLCGIIILLALSLNFFKIAFEHYIFSDVMLTVVMAGLYFCVLRAGLLLHFLIWKQKEGKRLKKGMIPRYRSVNLWGRAAENVEYFGRIPVIGILLLAAAWEGEDAVLFLLISMAGLLALLYFLIAVFRPKRENNWVFQILVVLLFPAVLVVNILFGSFEGREKTEAASSLILTEKEGTDIELIQTDFQEGILGGHWRYETRPEVPEKDEVVCEIYCSSSSWILDKIWTGQREYLEDTEKIQDVGEGGRKLQGTDRGGFFRTMILYKNKLICFRTGEAREWQECSFRH